MKGINMNDLEEFTAAYITAALWSESDEDGESIYTYYGVSDIDKETLAKMESDCAKFYNEFAQTIE